MLYIEEVLEFDPQEYKNTSVNTSINPPNILQISLRSIFL